MAEPLTYTTVQAGPPTYGRQLDLNNTDYGITLNTTNLNRVYLTSYAGTQVARFEVL